jgi:hypothetical protein
MADQEHQTQRDKRREKAQSGEPYGHLSAKHIRVREANAEAASQKTQHQGHRKKK